MILSTIENVSTYSKDRLVKYFGDLKTAKKRGYTITDSKDIFIAYSNLDGTPIVYTPKHIRDSIQKTEKNRKYGSMGDGAEHLQALEDSQIYGRTRKAKGKTRYLAPKREETNGLFVSFRPTLELTKAYNSGEKIETLHLFEGEFKADLLAACGVLSASFSGISTFSLTEDLKKIILNGLKNICLCYDGDLLNLSKKALDQGKNANERILNFFRSAKKFAKQLHEWLSEINEGLPKEEKTKVKLIFSHTNTDLKDKAADDLILSNPDKKDEIIKALLSKENNEYFSFFTLPKSSYENRLVSFFHLNSVRSFHNAYKDILKDQTFTFNHLGVKCSYRFCKDRNTVITESRPFAIEVKPIAHFAAYQYIGKIEKQKAEIFNLLDAIHKGFLSFPTGAGKTTIAEKYAKHYIDNEPTGTGKVYIIAPITRLGDQIARDIKKKFVYAREEDYTQKLKGKERRKAEKQKGKKQMERVTLARMKKGHKANKFIAPDKGEESKLIAQRLEIQKLLKTEKETTKRNELTSQLKEIRDKQRKFITPIYTPQKLGHSSFEEKNYDDRIIVCTSDCVKNRKIKVTENDLLIVDEAHDLTNHFGFRPETMRALHASFEVAKKVICLSATPNYNFIKNEGFKLITGDVEKRMHVNYVTHILEKNKTIKQAVINELLGSDLSEKVNIQGTNFFNTKQEHKVHIVFIDNKADLSDIRDYLVDLGFVTKEETAILTSDNQTKNKAFDDIVKKRLIDKKLKIIFTTRLLSEGINIKNKNIGKVLIGGVKCLDLLRQFPARFRKIFNLDVHLFWKSQSKIDSNYFEPTQRRTKHLFIHAKSHARTLQELKDEAEKNGEAFELIECYSELCDLAYIATDGSVKIDRLKVYAKEKERQTNTIPIDVLISELARLDNTTITDSQEKNEAITEEEKQKDKEEKKALKQIAEKRKEVQAEKKSVLLDCLEVDTDITLLGLCKALKHSKRYDLAKEISNLVPLSRDEHEHLKPEIEAKKEQILKCDCFAQVATQYVELLEHTDNPTALIRDIDTKTAFNTLTRSLKWTKLIADYQKGNTRQRKLNIAQRADAKGFIKIQKEVMKKFGGETFKTFEIYAFLRSMFNVRFVNKLGELKTSYSTITENKLERLVLCLFSAEKIATDTYTNIEPKTYENTLKTHHLK